MIVDEEIDNLDIIDYVAEMDINNEDNREEEDGGRGGGHWSHRKYLYTYRHNTHIPHCLW